MNGGYNGANGKALDSTVVEKLAEIRRPGSVFTFMDEEEASMTSGAFFVPTNQSNIWWMDTRLPGQGLRSERGGCRWARQLPQVAIPGPHPHGARNPCLQRTGSRRSGLGRALASLSR